MRLRQGDEVIAVAIAEAGADLLVVTENGYGKRTRVEEYPRKGRGGMGVKTVQLTEAKGQLAGARMVRDGMHLMMISTGGTVIRMPVDEVKRLGRSTQGVIVMRLRGDEQVSTLAPVAEGEPNGGEADADGADLHAGADTVNGQPEDDDLGEPADEVLDEPDDDDLGEPADEVLDEPDDE
jgi:DNA gyrase subunit A